MKNTMKKIIAIIICLMPFLVTGQSLIIPVSTIEQARLKLKGNSANYTLTVYLGKFYLVSTTNYFEVSYGDALLLSNRNLTFTGGTGVTVSNSGIPLDLSANRSWTISLPQSIATTATPTFAGITLPTGGLQNLLNDKLGVSLASSTYMPFSGGTLTGNLTVPKIIIPNAGYIFNGSDVAFGAGNTSDFVTYNPSGRILFSTNNAVRMAITNAGNVGIGTIAPTSKFEISGLSAFRYNDGNQANGKYLRSGSTGIALWDSVRHTDVAGLQNLLNEKSRITVSSTTVDVNNPSIFAGYDFIFDTANGKIYTYQYNPPPQMPTEELSEVGTFASVSELSTKLSTSVASSTYVPLISKSINTIATSGTSTYIATATDIGRTVVIPNLSSITSINLDVLTYGSIIIENTKATAIAATADIGSGNVLFYIPAFKSYIFYTDNLSVVSKQYNTPTVGVESTTFNTLTGNFEVKNMGDEVGVAIPISDYADTRYLKISNASSTYMPFSGGKFIGDITFANSASTSTFSDISTSFSTSGNLAKFYFDYHSKVGANTITWHPITFNSNGEVGINNQYPAYALDINGTTNSSTQVISPVFVGGTGTTSSITYKATTGNAVAGADHIFKVGAYAANEAMRILNNGNIGLGDTNPDKRLTVASPVADYGQYIHGSTTAGGSFGMLIDAGYNSSDYCFRARGRVGVEYFAIRGDGNVGIGTATPTKKLEVVGSDILVNGITVGRGGGSINSNSANGFQSLYSNTAGVSNVANGFQSLYSNTTGDNNSANGFQTLYSNTTGFNNVANGVQTLYSNTTGFNNSVNGFQSLYSNTTGFNNSANGVQTLYSNTTGFNNSANGVQTLYSNTTGFNNSVNGFQSLYSNTTGDNNSANGFQTLYSNTTGFNNVANGVQTLYSNTTGFNNSVNGFQSLYSNTTGFNNSANGVQTLYSNTAGVSNVANGFQSLYSNTTGSSNVAIGNQAGFNELGSNKLHIANNSTTSLIKGDFATKEVEFEGSIKLTNPYTAIVNGGATPVPTSGAGTMVFQASDSSFYGWNGTIWKKLDN